MIRFLTILVLLFSFNLKANNTYQDLLNDTTFQTQQVKIINLSTIPQNQLKQELENKTPENINFDIININTSSIIDLENDIMNINDTMPNVLIYLEDNFFKNTVLQYETNEDFTLQEEYRLMEMLANNEVILNIKNDRIEFCENKKYLNTHCIINKNILDNKEGIEKDFIIESIRKVYNENELYDLLAYSGILKTANIDMELSKIFLSIEKQNLLNPDVNYITLKNLNNEYSFISNEGDNTDIYGNVVSNPKDKVYAAGFSYINNIFYNELFIDKNSFVILTQNLEVNIYHQEGAIYGCLNKDCKSIPVDLKVNEEFIVNNKITKDLNNIKVILLVSDTTRLKFPPKISIIDIQNPVINDLLCKPEFDENGNSKLDEEGNIIYDKEHLKLGTVTFSQVPENINCINAEEMTNEYTINITEPYQEVYMGYSMPNLNINNPNNYFLNLTVGCVEFNEDTYIFKKIHNLKINKCLLFKTKYNSRILLNNGDLINNGEIITRYSTFVTRNLINNGKIYSKGIEIKGNLINKGNIEIYVNSIAIQLKGFLKNEGEIKAQVIKNYRGQTTGGKINFPFIKPFENNGLIHGRIITSILIDGLTGDLMESEYESLNFKSMENNFKEISQNNVKFRPQITCSIRNATVEEVGYCAGFSTNSLFDSDSYEETIYNPTNYKKLLDSYIFPVEKFQFGNIKDNNVLIKNNEEIIEEIKNNEELTISQKIKEILLKSIKIDLGNRLKKCQVYANAEKPQLKYEFLTKSAIDHLTFVATSYIHNYIEGKEKALSCAIQLGDIYDKTQINLENTANIGTLILLQQYNEQLISDLIKCYTDGVDKGFKNCNEILIELKDMNEQMIEYSKQFTDGFTCNETVSEEESLNLLKSKMKEFIRIRSINAGKAESCINEIINSNIEIIERIKSLTKGIFQ